MMMNFRGILTKVSTAVLWTALLASTTDAAETDLLVRALKCELRDSELATLPAQLAKQRPALGKPAQHYGAPSADLYELPSTVSAHGLQASQVVIAPTRVLMAVSGKSLSDISQALRLETIPYAPASRPVRPAVSVVALTLSHAALAGKVLVGCEYAHPAAARWVEGGGP